MPLFREMGFCYNSRIPSFVVLNFVDVHLPVNTVYNQEVTVVNSEYLISMEFYSLIGGARFNIDVILDGF